MVTFNGGKDLSTVATSTNPVPVELSGNGNGEINVQNPLPTDGDSVYCKDINTTNSNIGTFSPDDICSLFDDYDGEIVSSGATNPKTFTIRFNRPMETGTFGIGSKTGTFSNVKILLKSLSGNVRGIIDDSTNNTAYTDKVYDIKPLVFIEMVVEFHTTNTITLSGMFIPKNIHTHSQIAAISSINGTLEDIGSLRGALNVHNGDVHFFAVNRHFTVLDSATTTLNSAATQDDTSISVVNTAGFSVGDSIRLEEGTISEYDDILITVIAAGTPGTLTLDRPLDFTYTTSATVEKVYVDLENISAGVTLSSPVIAEIKPPAGEVWHIIRIILNMTHGSSADDGKFGGITALTNGVVMRQVTNTVGKQIISNWKTNGDIREDMYDVSYSDRAGGQGVYGTSGRFTFKKNDFVIELNGDDGDVLQLLIQDPIDDLTKFSVKAQGHISDR